jgi:hypothetical protein
MARDSVAELVGDGHSKVSVSMELKDKDMGSGFGAFVTVSLTCDGTESALDAASRIAMELSKEYVTEAHDMAREAYEETRR